MSFFTCPICKNPFIKQNRSLLCPNGHCYDVARQGYVNLLRPGGARRHGDDKRMVGARTAFLDAGFYNPLRDAVTGLVLKHAKNGDTILDAGCGEGFYTSHIREALAKTGTGAHVCGIDVSRDAVVACAARDRSLELAVASITAIPAAAQSVDILVNLFAPCDATEFARVMKPGAALIRAFPDRRHLFELKEAIYETPYENEISTLKLDGFSLLSEQTLRFPLRLTDPEQIQALFQMTPYYYKTGREDQEKLLRLASITTNAQFILAEYCKSA